MLHPNIRTNCRHLFAFRYGDEDAITLSKDFACRELRDIIPNLPPYHFAYVDKMIGKAKIFVLEGLDSQKDAYLREVSL
jgi:hypothetical protein